MAFPTFNSLMANWFGSHGRRHKAYFIFQPAAGDFSNLAESDETNTPNAEAFAEGTAEVPMGSSLVVGAATGVNAGRQCVINLTTAGTVTMKLAGDGSSVALGLPVGTTFLNWAVQGATLSGGAVGTVTNLF